MKEDRAAVAAPNSCYKDKHNAELIQADSLKKCNTDPTLFSGQEAASHE